LDEEFLPIDADTTSTLAHLKRQVHDGTGFPIPSIQFFLNGAPVVGDDQTLDQAGIKNGEMLYMLVREQNNMTNHQPRQQQPQRSQQARFSNDQIETLRLQLLGNPHAMQQVSQERPELAAAASDPARFRELYITSVQQADSSERERREQMQLLNDDPFNIEAQQKIEEIIRQDRVMENLEYAYEHNPEGMLVIHV
jgi:DNA damage-inducible protein 1